VLSVRETARLARALDAELAGATLERVVQRDDTTLELSFRPGVGHAGGRRRLALRLSAEPGLGHAGLVLGFAPAPPTPPAFAQLLRARLGRARVSGVGHTEGERELGLGLLGREGEHRLLLCLHGARSNLYLLGPGDVLLGALRPLASTRPELAPGRPWQPLASAPPPAGEDRYRELPDAALAWRIAEEGARAADARRREALAREVARALRDERRRLARRGEALAADLARSGEAATLRRHGELLKTVLHRVRSGEAEVTAQDPATGEAVPIALDPALSPARNLERLFARYQRASRREQAVARQQRELEQERAALAGLEERLAALERAGTADVAAREALAQSPPLAALLGRRRSRRTPQPSPRRREAPGRGKGPPLRLRPARYRTHDGLEVWVGRNAEGNDFLTTRLARGNDLFLHLEDGPGSHVILRTQGRRDVPQESLLEAAELALHFSKARQAGRAGVRVAAVRDVRKPRGARPGLVQVMRSRSLALRHEPARLRGVLSRRLDEPG